MKYLFCFAIGVATILSACQQPPGQMSEESAEPSKSVELVNRFFDDVLNQKKMDVLDSLLHPSFHSHHYPTASGSDKALFTQSVKDMIVAFPDFHITTNQQYGKGDHVFSYFSWTGTQQGMFNGIAPTNKKVNVEGMDIWREQDGQLIENWVIMDILGLMTQLGAIPSAGEPNVSE